MPSVNDVTPSVVSPVPYVLSEWEVRLNGRESVSMVETQWNTKWHVRTQNQKSFS